MPDAPEFQLFTEGDELYAAMLADMAAAATTLRVESYIFADDAVGQPFIDALAAHAGSGRSARLRVDAVGSGDVFSEASIARLAEAGVEVNVCLRWSPRRFWKFQRRNHRKLTVIDDQVAYVGGFNIHKENSRSVFGERRWRDTHVRLTGALAAAARAAWDDYGRRRIYQPPADRSAPYLLPNRGLRGAWQLHRLLRTRIRAARTRVWLTTPYFVPDEASQRALRAAARRGVDVRVLVPAKSDVRIVQWAGRAAYSGLLGAGVKIFEYQPRVLHAKTLLVDDDFATIGTANFDYRSFFINDEINAIFPGPLVANELARLFDRDLTESRAVTLTPWPMRPLTAVLAESVGWLARRWL